MTDFHKSFMAKINKMIKTENNLLSNNKEKLRMVKSQDKIGQTQKSLRNEEIDSAKADEPPKNIKTICNHPK